jgi:phage-related holin
MLFSAIDCPKFTTVAYCSWTAVIIAFYEPIANLLFAALILSCVDLVLGLLCAKYYQIIPITSKRFIDKLKSSGLYWVVVSCLMLAGPAFEQCGYHQYIGASYLSVLYIFYELLSILEHCSTMGFPLAIRLSGWLNNKHPFK